MPSGNQKGSLRFAFKVEKLLNSYNANVGMTRSSHQGYGGGRAHMKVFCVHGKCQARVPLQTTPKPNECGVVIPSNAVHNIVSKENENAFEGICNLA